MPKFTEADHSITHAVLEDQRVQLELILDGHHLYDEIVKMVIEKAKDRILLITDAMAAAGSADGNYKIGDLEVVVKGGAARLATNGSLAGSTLVLDFAISKLSESYLH
jgi:N-acetylglucosamine-6-phosphate deacetylase